MLERGSKFIIQRKILANMNSLLLEQTLSMQAELAWSGRQEELLSGADAKLESLQWSTLDLSVGFCK